MLLIIEDDPLIADDLADLMASEFRVEVIVRHSLAEAMGNLDHRPSFALLDIDLGDGKVFPVADHLLAEGTPFAFLSGSRQQDLPERFRGCAFMPKPYHEQALLALVRPHVVTAA